MTKMIAHTLFFVKIKKKCCAPVSPLPSIFDPVHTLGTRNPCLRFAAGISVFSSSRGGTMWTMTYDSHTCLLPCILE